MLGRWAGLLVDHRRIAAGLLGLVAVAVLAGALRLRIDFSSAAFYGDDGRRRAELARFVEAFGPDDASLIAVAERPDGAGWLEPDGLETLAALAEHAETIDGVRSAVSIASLPIPDPRGGPPRPAAAWLGRGPEGRATVLASPLVPALLSRDAQTAALVIELDTSSDDVARAAPRVEAVAAALAQEAAAHPGVTVRVAGVPAVRTAFFRLVLADQLRFVPLTLAIIGLALLAVFRSRHGVVVPALAAGLPTGLLAGVLGWADEPIGLLNQAYFTLLPVIAVADAIHLVARYEEALRRTPASRRDRAAQRAAIVEALEHVGAACLSTSTTTALGFLSLLAAHMPILRRFGSFAAVGVALAFLVAITLVPLALSWSDPARVPEAPPGGDRLGDQLARLARGSARAAPMVVAVSVLVLGLAVLAGRRVEVDNFLGALLQPEHPVRRAGAVVDAELGGILGLELDLEGPPGLALAPETHAGLTRLEAWARRRPEVRAIDGPLGRLAALHLRPSATATAAARDHATLRGLYGDALPGGTEGRRLRLSLRTADLGGRRFAALADAAEAEARAALPGVEVRATGTALLAYRGVNGITEDLRTSLLGLFVVVTLLIGLVLRSARLAVAAVLPNLLPLAVGYALVGLAGVVLDPLSAVILTLAVGLAVDDSIHVLARAREAERAGRGPLEAIAESAAHGGRAVLVTSLVLAGGLSVNLGSSFPPLVALGALGTAVILLALGADLVVLPACWALARGGGGGIAPTGGRAPGRAVARLRRRRRSPSCRAARRRASR